MKKLNEYEIAENYINKPVNTEKLSKTFNYNGNRDLYSLPTPEKCQEYIAGCYYFDEDEWELFGLTDKLYDYWDYNGIDFRIYVYTHDGIIKQCNIFKYKEDGYYARASITELTPTQQEIRIFRRIMDYITK